MLPTSRDFEDAATISDTLTICHNILRHENGPDFDVNSPAACRWINEKIALNSPAGKVLSRAAMWENLEDAEDFEVYLLNAMIQLCNFARSMDSMRKLADFWQARPARSRRVLAENIATAFAAAVA